MVLDFLKGNRNVKVEMEDGTQKVATMVEGSGVFVCHIHEFVTEDLNEFNVHLKTAEHTLVAGSHGRCVICRENFVDMSGYPAGENPVCATCEDRLSKSRERVHARLAAAESSKKGKTTK